MIFRRVDITLGLAVRPPSKASAVATLLVPRLTGDDQAKWLLRELDRREAEQLVEVLQEALS